MIPKVWSVNSVIRLFKINKGRVKVGTTLWFLCLAAWTKCLKNKHRLNRATDWIEAKLRVRNISILNTPLGH